MEVHTAGTRPVLLATALGIPLQVDRGWLFTLAGTALAGAWGVARTVPESGLAAQAAMGVVVAIGVWASLLAHELAHAVMATRAGSAVLQIRFFAGGALCRRRDTIDSPDDQLRVAAAGPVVNAVLAALTALLALAVPVAALAAALWFLCFANAVIAVTNLLPVLPLDGGKVMQALLWRRMKERKAASERARRNGREFARVVICVGVLMVAMSGEVLLGGAVAGFGVYLLRMRVPL